MLDREKVINELVSYIENALSVDFNYVDCIPTDLLQYAVALLKKQEPIPCGEKIKAGDVMLDFYECGYCRNAIRKPWNYCPFCGKAVKWDD